MKSKKGLLLAFFVSVSIALLLIVASPMSIFAAEENVLTINAPEIRSLNNMSQEQREAFWILEDYDLIYFDWNDETQIETVYNSETGNVLFTDNRDNNDGWVIRINEDLTVNDNIEFVFPEKLLENIDSWYPSLSGYTGINFVFSNNEFLCVSVCIKGLKLEDISDNAALLSRASFDDLKIYSDIRLIEEGDFVRYKVTLLNNTNEDYEMSAPDKGDEYVSYEYDFKDGNVAKSRNESIVYITIKYSNTVPSAVFNDGAYNVTNSLTIDLENDTSNPVTIDNLTILISVLCVSIGIIAVVFNVTKGKKRVAIVSIIVVGVVVVPIACTNAINKYQIIIESKVSIPKVVTLAYDKGNENATGEMGPQTVIAGESISIASNQFSMENSAFVGWNTKADGSGEQYNPGDSAAFYEDTTLYAMWESYYYWALQDNDNNDSNETLVFSKYELAGNRVGRINPNAFYGSVSSVPWVNSNYDSDSNLSKDVTTVNVKDEIAPRNMLNWFNGVGYNAETFYADVTKMNTKNAVSFLQTFNMSGHNARTYEIVGLDSWDMGNVTNMQAMFQGAGRAAEEWSIGNVSGWNTSKVANMSYMFSVTGIRVERYTIEGIKDWDVGNVTDLTCMFQGIGSYGEEIDLDLSGWDTKNVTRMNGMFWTAGTNVKTMNVNMSGWNLEKMTSFERLFESYGSDSSGTGTKRVILDVSGWNTPNVTSLKYLFMGAADEADEFIVRGLEDWDTSKVTDMSAAFYGAASNASTIDIGNIGVWNTSNVTDFSSMFGIFGESVDNFYLDLSSWDTGKVETIEDMFWANGMNSNDVYINVSNWNTKNITNMRSAFTVVGAYATGNVTIDMRGWDMSNVTNLENILNSVGSRTEGNWQVIIPRTNGNGLSNSPSILYGANASVYVTPRSLAIPTRSFTLAP